MSGASLAVFLLTVAIPVFALAGLVQAWRQRHAAMRRGVWWLAFVTSVMMTVVAAYLAVWGVVGLRTWG